MASQSRRGHGHQRTRTNDHDERTQNGVDALVVQPARRDVLIDNVGLLKVELPGSHGGANDGDDQEHRSRVGAAANSGDDTVARDGAQVWMGYEDQGHDDEVERDEDHHEPFPTLERSRSRHPKEQDHGEGNRDEGAHAEVAHGERDANELGDDDEKVQQQDRSDRNVAPIASEPLSNQAPVPDTGDRP